MSKDAILERYLNMAYYGDKCYGVEAAAQHYFGVSAADLDLAQAAMIAGLVQAPGLTDPVHNPERAIERRNHVLERMADPEIGFINSYQLAEAKAVDWDPEGVVTKPTGCANSKYPFICDYIKTTLLSEKMTSIGETRADRERLLYRSGLSIYTVISPSAQNSAQRAVSRLIDPRDPVIGVAVLIQPKTGLIVAMAQSRPVQGNDSKKGQTFWNYAVGTDMGGPEGFQGGSTFKVFTLANALSVGVPMGTQYMTPGRLDVSGQSFVSCSGPFRTGRYSVRGGSGKPINLLAATASSVNTYFIQLERDTSICGAVKMAQAAGVKASLARNGGYDLIKNWHADYWPSFTLGTLEVSPLSMASAFATFANRGKHCEPIIIEKVVSLQGDEYAVPNANCKQTINANVAAGVTQALRGVMTHGTGTAARLGGGYPHAGKSGTTDSAWAIAFGGYTVHMAGFATIAVDRKHSYWKGKRVRLGGFALPYSKTYLQGAGGRDAGRIWNAAMTAAIKGTPKTGFPAYKPITGWHSPNTYTPPPPKPKPTKTPSGSPSEGGGG